MAEFRWWMTKGVGVSVAKTSKKAPPKKQGKPVSKASSNRSAKRPSKTIKAKATTKSKKPAIKSAVKATPRIAPKVAPIAKPNGRSENSKPSNKALNKAARTASESDIIPAPPPPRGKPAKNLAGLSNKELEMFRDMLFAKRRELVGDMYSMEREALQRSGENLSNLPLHMADMGTDNYEQEFTLGLMEKDRQLLREINQSLSKIMDGRYGICEGTGKPISKARLEVQPWAKYSIEYARKLENRGVR